MTELEKNIDDYINGRLNASEKNVFEDKLRLDKNLRSEVKTYLEIQQVLRGANNSNLLEKNITKEKEYLNLLLDDEGKNILSAISKAEGKYFSKAEEKKISQKRWVYLTIGVFIAVFIYFFYFSARSDISNSQIYASYKDYSSLPSLTSRGDEEGLTNGERLFGEGKYKEALKFFSDNNANDNIRTQVKLYIACCQLELDKDDEAIIILEQLTNGASLDSGIAKWYLSQAYIKIDNEESAIKLLKEIAADVENFKYSAAKDVLNRLSLKKN